MINNDESVAVFYFVGKDMAAKQKLEIGDDNRCNIDNYNIYTYSSFAETFVTLFRASMGGYDVSAEHQTLCIVLVAV